MTAIPFTPPPAEFPDARTKLGWTPGPPPDVECPWCGAAPGSPCRVLTLIGNRRHAPRVRSTPDGCHAARRAVA